MRKFLSFSLSLLAASAAAQTANFETLSLPGSDTFYVNYSNPGKDVGFTENFIHFPCVYDTAFGGLWSTGFAYSNRKDSVTSGYMNMYSAKTAKGRNSSDKYAVYNAGYGQPMPITVMPGQSFVPQGFYITNSTYAFNSMRDGDFVAKKFGGTTGNDADWFKVTIFGYLHGIRKSDSVVFYLADFRNPDNSKDYILKDWQYVNLLPLAAVDSIDFLLSSSDNGAFGMNTPAYFCMDDISVAIPITSVGKTPGIIAGTLYPNPAKDRVFVDLKDRSIATVYLVDASGSILVMHSVDGEKVDFNLTPYAPGVYFIQLKGDAVLSSQRFIKL